jgi:hypothetical protein
VLATTKYKPDLNRVVWRSGDKAAHVRGAGEEIVQKFILLSQKH